MSRPGDVEESTDDIERIEPPGGEGATVKIDLQEPDDDADDEGGENEPPRAARGDEKPPKGSEGMVRDKVTGQWTKKKQERGRLHKENLSLKGEKEALERRIAESEAAYQRRFAEMEARMARSQQPAQTQQTADPHAAKLADLNKQIEAELRLIETDEKRGYERYNELQEMRTAAVVARELAQFQAKQPAQQPQTPRGPYDARAPFIQAEFPWTEDPRCKPLNEKAWKYREYLIHVEGRPDTIDTDREALAHIQAQFGAGFGLQPPARPTQQQRNGYIRPPATGGGGTRQAPRAIELPRVLTEGTGLSPESLRAALREE